MVFGKKIGARKKRSPVAQTDPRESLTHADQFVHFLLLFIYGVFVHRDECSDALYRLRYLFPRRPAREMPYRYSQFLLSYSLMRR